MTAFVLLAAGIAVGWLGSRLADSQVTDCPRCAIEDDERQVLMEISAQQRQAEAEMRSATASVRQQAETPRHRRADDMHQVDMFGGGR
jgi:hypothetical protein